VKKFFALFIAATLALTGCSNVDSAATVGDTEISLTDLQAQIELINSERKSVDTSQMQLETGDGLSRSQLSYMISNIVIEALAKDEEIKVSNSEIESYKAEIFTNIGGEENLPNVLVSASIPSTAVNEVLRRDLILRKLTEKQVAAGADESSINAAIQKLVTDKANALKVTVNPRYGTWDSNTLAVVAAEPAGDAVTDK
jgi:FKBP-type peptidyl-prolyl cis-trans isomerase (trigger factor)